MYKGYKAWVALKSVLSNSAWIGYKCEVVSIYEAVIVSTALYGARQGVWEVLREET